MAQSYREALRRTDPDTAHALDTWAVDHGQGWVVGATWDYDEYELLTIREAANRANVQIRTIYQWHRRGLRYTATADGPRVRADHLVDYIRDRRRARAGRGGL